MEQPVLQRLVKYRLVYVLLPDPVITVDGFLLCQSATWGRKSKVPALTPFCGTFHPLDGLFVPENAGLRHAPDAR